MPVWLSEGLAEYVSVRPLPPERRGISQTAVDAARAGFTDLPADQDFNDADSRAHYGESWWACEYVAASYGERDAVVAARPARRPRARHRRPQRRRCRRLDRAQHPPAAARAGKLLLLTFARAAPVGGQPGSSAVREHAAGRIAAIQGRLSLTD